MVLLLIMVVGLFILRRHDGGMFGLTGLLWKQVLWRFSLAVVLTVLIFFSFLGGHLVRTCHRH